MSVRNVYRHFDAFSAYTSQERQGFQAMAGMFPRRATLTKLPEKDTSTVLQQGVVCQAPPTPLGKVPHAVLKVTIRAQDSQQECCAHLHLLRGLPLLKAALQSIVKA